MPIPALITFFLTTVIGMYLGYLAVKNEPNNKPKVIGIIILSLILLGFGIFDILSRDYDTKADKKEIIDSTKISVVTAKDEIKIAVDSTKQAILDSITNGNAVVVAISDSNTKKILNKNTLPDLIPVLEIVPPNPQTNLVNPIVSLSARKDSLNLSIGIGNIGNDLATDIADKIVFITYDRKDSMIDIGAKPIPLFNKRIVLPPKQEMVRLDFPVYYLDLSRIEASTQKVYIYLRCQFSNSKGKVMPPFRCIFRLTKTSLDEIISSEYNRIENDLKKLKFY